MFFLYKIYSFISFIIYPFLIILLKIRIIKKKESKTRWKEKLGFYNIAKPKGKLVWINVASVGEMNSVIPLISYLKKHYNILVTSTTLSSSENFNIKNLLENGSNVVFHQFAPLDSIVCVKRFLSHFKPNLACMVESEIWPNLIAQTSKICKVISVNTSLSPKSMQSWKDKKNLFRWIFSHFALITPSSYSLAKELSQNGLSNITFIGNLKYDLPKIKLNNCNVEFKEKKDVLCFANIHEKEIYELIETIQEAIKREIYLIFIPRHIEKIPNLLDVLKNNNILYDLKSKNNNPEIGKLFIVDEIGVNTDFYSISTVIIMGGSFIEIGGHNIIEPAYFEKPIIIGEFYFKCKEVVEKFLQNNAVLTTNSKNLSRLTVDLLENKTLQNTLSKNAKQCCDFYKGASLKMFNLIKLYL